VATTALAALGPILELAQDWPPLVQLAQLGSTDWAALASVQDFAHHAQASKFLAITALAAVEPIQEPQHSARFALQVLLT